MSHYFIEDKTLASRPTELAYSLRGLEFRFVTDAGVFARDAVDYVTDALLNNLPELSGSLLDLGCGYGCIGIALGKLFGLSVTLADVNPAALRLAAINCGINGVKAEIVESDCYGNISGTFDAIVINPPIHAGKAVTYGMFEGAAAHLNPGGQLLVVTLKKHGAESTVSKIADIFGGCDILYKKKGIYIIRGRVRS